MRLSVATNFDDELPPNISRYGAVDVFGKLPSDALGGGRASYMLSPTSKKRLEQHVKSVHRAGMGFNYLINPACIGNQEFTYSGQRSIRSLLDWLAGIGVDSITVSIPYLLELIKTRYPDFKVKIGVFANVDTPKKARYFEELGADCITLQPLVLNRDFARLKAIRESVSCDLQLIVNSNCLCECPMTPYHNVGLSHASQRKSKGYFIDYCLLSCLREKLLKPSNYIRSPWIRPEDTHHYEAIGYSNFKILERDAPTATLISRCEAYANRHFEGNLIDLVQCYGYKESRSTNQPKRGKLWDFATFIKPSKANPLRMLPMKELAKLQGMIYDRSGNESVFHVDNRALDGFIDRFLQLSCTNLNCEECRYCDDYADRALVLDENYRHRCLQLTQQLLSDLNTGRMWD